MAAIFNKATPVYRADRIISARANTMMEKGAGYFLADRAFLADVCVREGRLSKTDATSLAIKLKKSLRTHVSQLAFLEI